MSHDTHGHHHDTHNDKPVVEFKSAFYFVLILAGLFIASIAFIKSMSHNEGGHEAHGAAHTEAGHAEHQDAHHEATEHEATAPTHHDSAAHAEAEHHEEAAPEHH